jgi:hypothetical protein
LKQFKILITILNDTIVYIESHVTGQICSSNFSLSDYTFVHAQTGLPLH